MPLEVHVVSHTHWDREWYRPFERFRQQLVALVDDLLRAPPRGGASFLLDGQAILLEDYLAVRPDRAAALSELLHEGRLEAGPWYVLADELIPSGEALVRNLLAGRRALERLGAAAPPALYCPDSFGHPAALPSIAAGFGLGVVVLWRGYGGDRWPAGDTVRWRAADGAEVLLYHLPRDGYEFGASLPAGLHDDAAVRWTRIQTELSPRAALGVVLLLNGADHHARQRSHDAAIAALATAAAPDVVHESSLRRFVTTVIDRSAAESLPVISGELRDSYGYTWTLQGTFATRAGQKRANAGAERALIRSAEPWSALAWFVLGQSRGALLANAWRSLLTAHPHDTLCGCSIDAVAVAMDSRVEAAKIEAHGVRDDALGALVEYDADAAFEHKALWRSVVVVRNESAHERGGVVVFDLLEFLAHEPVGPGSAPSTESSTTLRRGGVRVDGARAMQVLSRRVGRDRLEAPSHYPDNDIVTVTRVAAVVDPVPGYGLTALPVVQRLPRNRPLAEPVRAKGRTLDNGIVRVEVGDHGAIRFADARFGHTIESLVAFEDMVDCGDLYTPSLRGVAAVAAWMGAKRVHRGPVLGELLATWALRAPGSRRRASIMATVELSLIVEAGSPIVKLRVRGVNTGRDHRLRMGFNMGIADPMMWADAAFGPVRRRPIDIPIEDTRLETPQPTAPLHRYVSLYDATRAATLFSDGLAEYEATKDGSLYVTLLRAVGELSRNDLPERPGHAGWPMATPAAQCPGSFEAEFGFMVHGPRSARTIDEVERASDDVLTPLMATTLRSALATAPGRCGVQLAGTGLASSTIKESEDGQWVVLRCVNLTDEEQDGMWTLGQPIREAAIARLDETPIGPLPTQGSSVKLRVPAHGIVTVLVRP